MGRIKCNMNLQYTVCDMYSRFLQYVTEFLPQCLWPDFRLTYHSRSCLPATQDLLCLFLRFCPHLQTSFDLPVALLRTVTCCFFKTECSPLPGVISVLSMLPLCARTASCSECTFVEPASCLFPEALSLLLLPPSLLPGC